MKLLDKKRIKTKKGEHLALNERNMLAKVGTVGRGRGESALIGDSQASFPDSLLQFLCRLQYEKRMRRGWE